jgi:hypothetical protein
MGSAFNTRSFLAIPLKRLVSGPWALGLGHVLWPEFLSSFTDTRENGQYVDSSQMHVARRMVRDRRQGLGQFRFGRREGRLP